jgi:hypothetical protein
LGERGHAAVEFALGVGLLLIPVAILVLGFGPWSERRVVAEAAAAEAARTAVLSLDVTAAGQVVSEIGANHGVEPEDMLLGWCGSTPAAVADAIDDCPLARGTVVEAEVRIWAPVVETPWGAIGGLWVIARHVEPIDLYRSLG